MSRVEHNGAVVCGIAMTTSYIEGYYVSVLSAMENGGQQAKTKLSRGEAS